VGEGAHVVQEVPTAAAPETYNLVGILKAIQIQLANWSALRYSEQNEGELPRMQRHLRIGALQYFVRLMASHLHETLFLVEKFSKQPELEKILDNKCSKYGIG
jgi:hypothetical protein